VLTEILAGAGYEVVEVSNGDECIRALGEAQETSRPFHFVISDVRMPVRTGLEVARVARRLWPSLHVILMTAYPDAHARQVAHLLGVEAFLTKPFSLDQLVELFLRRLRP
jgi:CheY-like chemotaxis protein